MQGGVGDCTNEIAQELAKRGVEVSVLTTGDDRRTTNDERRGLEDPSPFSVFRTIKKWDWSALSQIRQILAEIDPDIFHIQYQTGAFGMHPMINFALQFLSRSPFRTGTRVRSVVTFHDLRPMYLFPKAGRVRDWVTFQLARTTDAVIATNQEDYKTLFALHLKLLTCIPIGSNIDPTPPPDFDRAVLRSQLGVRDDEILLSYFGFLNESKGGETLIRAFAEIPNAKLLMLGGQTGGSDVTNVAYLRRVKKLVADLELSDRVLWTDFLSPPEVSAHFLASDVCVLPYRDGASYRRGTFMAALAHGMAIVTTGVGAQGTGDRGRGTGDGDSRLPQLRGGENVLLVPPDDAHAIAEAVKEIASSSELRERLQRGALETAKAFTWDKIAEAHLELYKKLLLRE